MWSNILLVWLGANVLLVAALWGIRTASTGRTRRREERAGQRLLATAERSAARARQRAAIEAEERADHEVAARAEATAPPRRAGRLRARARRDLVARETSSAASEQPRPARRRE